MRGAFLAFLTCVLMCAIALYAAWRGNMVSVLVNTHLAALMLGVMIGAIATGGRR